MTFILQTFIKYAPIFILTAFLTACAVQSPEIAKPVDNATATAPAAGKPTTHTPESSNPQETVTEATAHATGTPMSKETALVRLFNGIPHGMTEDGFPYLGVADAGVTLIDYSDFL
jgi:hypothetical protein